MIGFYIIFFLSSLFIDWNNIFNVDPSKVPNLKTIINIVFIFICCNFLFRTVGNIYMAYQYSAANDFFSFIGNLVSLLIIYILTLTTNGSLDKVAYTFSGVPAIVYLIAFPVTFKIFPKISPSIKYIRKDYFKDLIGLGIKFMIIQIAFVVIFLSSNLLISRLFGPQDVTPYNIAFKYFSIITIGFNIVLSPFWSAITDACSRNDFEWIKKTIKRLLLIWIIFTFGTLCLLIIAPFAYKIWIGNEVQIPLSLSILCAIYVTVVSLGNIFAYLINGLGKLRIQLIFAVIQSIVYIPLAVYLSKIYGVEGIISALCIISAASLLWSPLQTYLLLNKKATGIWLK